MSTPAIRQFSPSISPRITPRRYGRNRLRIEAAAQTARAPMHFAAHFTRGGDVGRAHGAAAFCLRGRQAFAAGIAMLIGAMVALPAVLPAFGERWIGHFSSIR